MAAVLIVATKSGQWAPFVAGLGSDLYIYYIIIFIGISIHVHCNIVGSLFV